jgi:hypothetical protein
MQSDASSTAAGNAAALLYVINEFEADLHAFRNRLQGILDY